MKLWQQILLAIILGATPNFMFGVGTALALSAKSRWPAVAFIISGFVAYAVAIAIGRSKIE